MNIYFFQIDDSGTQELATTSEHGRLERKDEFTFSRLVLRGVA